MSSRGAPRPRRATTQDRAELGPALRAWGRTQAVLGSAAAPFFGELDVTTAQMRALGQLKHHGRMSGRDLAARLGVTPATVVPLSDRLEERGYLRRVPDSDDRRLTWLELTPAGEEFFQRLWLPSRAKLMEALAAFTPQELGTFERLLNRVADQLENPGPRELGPRAQRRRR